MNFQANTVQELIDAINSANGAGGSHTITLMANAAYWLNSVQDNSDGPTGLPLINCNLTIYGSNATIRRDGNARDYFRLLHIASGKTVTINDLTLQGGRLGGQDYTNAAGILNKGTLTLNACALLDNIAAALIGSYGGAVNNGSGTLTLTDCLVANNQATNGGGLAGGNITATNSRFINQLGAAIWVNYNKDGVGEPQN